MQKFIFYCIVFFNVIVFSGCYYRSNDSTIRLGGTGPVAPVTKGSYQDAIIKIKMAKGNPIKASTLVSDDFKNAGIIGADATDGLTAAKTTTVSTNNLWKIQKNIHKILFSVNPVTPISRNKKIETPNYKSASLFEGVKKNKAIYDLKYKFMVTNKFTKESLTLKESVEGYMVKGKNFIVIDTENSSCYKNHILKAGESCFYVYKVPKSLHFLHKDELTAHINITSTLNLDKGKDNKNNKIG